MDVVQIVGAGGIGCAVGYALCAAGVRVTFVEQNPAKVAAGQRDGVRVDERSPHPAEFIHFDDWKPLAGVPVLLCTKCYDNAAVLAKLQHGVELIPIQNGFDSQLDAFGHTTEGIASFVSECDADRPHTRITRKGELHLGMRTSLRPLSSGSFPPTVSQSLDTSPTRGEDKNRERVSLFLPSPLVGEGGESSSRVGGKPFPAERLAGSSKRERLFSVVHVADISPIKHSKLMYNAAISPLAAAAGIDNGQLLSVPVARRLFFALLQENHRILSAADIQLGKVGPFHPSTVAWILRQKWLASVMAKFFEPSLRGTYCSMAGEIQKGRTEIDNYNGHLIRLAEQTGTPCPLNRMVFELVTRMTAARTMPARDVLNTLIS